MRISPKSSCQLRVFIALACASSRLNLLNPRYVISIACVSHLFLSGCDLDHATDRERNLVVISATPTLLTKRAVTFTTNELAKIMGESSTVCFVVKDGVPLQDVNILNELVVKAIHGAQINVDVLLADGRRLNMKQPSQSWAKKGRVLQANELAACASFDRSTNIATNVIVNKIEISSSAPVEVKGIYWLSEKSIREKAQTNKLGQTTNRVSNEQANK